MRAIAIALVIAVIAVSAVDAVESAGGRMRRINRRAVRSASQQRVTCTADAMERAMEQARAGNADWFDTLKSGLGVAVDGVVTAAKVTADATVTAAKATADASVTAAKATAKGVGVAVDAVGDAAKVTVDALNIVKQWECKRCDKCLSAANDLSKNIIEEILKSASDAVIGSSVCLGFDAMTTGLCAAICTPIPVPGLCPVVCPPFVIYAHSKCSDIVSDVTREIVASADLKVKVARKALTKADVRALQPANICTKLSLCPLTRKDCDAPSSGPASPRSTAPARK